MLESDDPFNLRRFADRQRSIYSQALQEVKSGRKKSHWMWFIFPTPPHMENGVECGSPKNQFYAIRSDEEALAYLKFDEDGVNLRDNYLEILQVLVQHLKLGVRLEMIMGDDEHKLKSSVKLFSEIAQQKKDHQLQQLCEDVLQLSKAGSLPSNCGSDGPLCSLCTVQ